MYVAGTVLSVLLMRGGSLNGLSRYVFCTPFYFIMLIAGGQKLVHVKKHLKTVAYIISFIITAFALSFIDYSSKWDFRMWALFYLFTDGFFHFPSSDKSDILWCFIFCWLQFGHLIFLICSCQAHGYSPKKYRRWEVAEGRRVTAAYIGSLHPL